jgi:hypothetical protein
LCFFPEAQDFSALPARDIDLAWVERMRNRQPQFTMTNGQGKGMAADMRLL